jgi:hypothetical protein
MRHEVNRGLPKQHGQTENQGETHGEARIAQFAFVSSGGRAGDGLHKRKQSCAGNMVLWNNARRCDVAHANTVRLKAALFPGVAPNLDKIERGFWRKNVANAHSGLDFKSAR